MELPSALQVVEHVCGRMLFRMDCALIMLFMLELGVYKLTFHTSALCFWYNRLGVPGSAWCLLVAIGWSCAGPAVHWVSAFTINLCICAMLGSAAICRRRTRSFHALYLASAFVFALTQVGRAKQLLLPRQVPSVPTVRGCVGTVLLCIRSISQSQ